jgi:hypothetical protein
VVDLTDIQAAQSVKIIGANSSGVETNPVNADANGNLNVVNTPVDGQRSTYSAAILNLATATLATDIFTLTGSATKTIRVLRLGISGIGGSTNNFAYQVIKRSTANTGGTSTTPTAVPHDSNDAAATATVRAYTANPTLGTAIGTIRAFRFATTASNTLDSSYEEDFGMGPEKAIVLRGTSEVFALNLNGVTITGSSLDLFIEWSEES